MDMVPETISKKLRAMHSVCHVYLYYTYANNNCAIDILTYLDMRCC